MSEHPPFIVGIDLGTTNSAVAYIDLRAGDEAGRPPVQVFEVPQLVGPGRVEPRPLLPSFVYLPGSHELPPGATALPWAPDRQWVVGEYAREQGSVVPGRLVSSAKSWLCHPHVDRTADLLPWGAADGVERISPVEASARLLGHIREAWNWTMARTQPAWRLERQQVVLTVPASFDAVARELTCEAARRAGIEHFTLLEEPQAAFYCWIEEHDGRWDEALPEGGMILVCDIGGGTTDLSLVHARPQPGQPPSFERVAVGTHLLLGGDNMDLALAVRLEQEAGGRGKLSARQWALLAQRCRAAKETLLAPDAPAEVTVSVPGTGSKLVGGAIARHLRPSDVDEAVLDAFFPDVDAGEAPRKTTRAAIQQFGLPYESDPAATRHIAAFLRAQAANVDEAHRQGGLVRPDAILFNGGATASPRIRKRLARVLAGWFGRSEPLPQLDNDRPDLAVALGAAYYGAVRRGLGLRIRGGSARAWYVGLAPQPGDPEGSVRVVCVVPHGIEEGRRVEVPREFVARTNEPVEFSLWASSTRLDDRPGDVAVLPKDSLEPLPPVRTVLGYGRRAAQQHEVPVRIEAEVTEIGTLSLHCAAMRTPHRWKLDFDLRSASGLAGASADAEPVAHGEVVDEADIEKACALVASHFAGDDNPSRLLRAIERTLGRPRAKWPPSLLRAMWATLLEHADARTRSARHEGRWLQLAGFSLRPGRGYPGDELRVRALWQAVFASGVHHVRDGATWVAWWVMWRRVAAGLSRGQQIEILGRINALITPRKVDPLRAGRPRPDAGEVRELWQAAASLERVERASRLKLGELALKRLTAAQIEEFGTWVLARLGARIPLYAGIDAALPPEPVAKWVAAVAQRRFKNPQRVGLHLVQMARRTGDRARDLPAEAVAQVEAFIADLPDAAHLRELLHEPVALRADEQAQLLGDTLPPGLSVA